MVGSPFPGWSAIQWRDIAAGAQTERRGGARPVGGLLGGKDTTSRFVVLAHPWATVEDAACEPGQFSIHVKRSEHRILQVADVGSLHGVQVDAVRRPLVP